MPVMASLETRHHEGSTTYRVVWREDGVKQRLTLTDPTEAARFKQLVEGSGNRWPVGWQRPTKAAPPSKPKELTFGGWAETAISRRIRANERTKGDYRRDLERHFKFLLDRPLTEITADDVVAWIESRQHLSGKTIRNLYGFASSLYADAMSAHPPVATWNPFGGKLADVAAVRTEEMVFLTHQEFATVHRLVRPEYQPLIFLLAGTGLRFGEATALQVRDVDILDKRKTLTVTKAWKRIDGATWVIGEPKTKRSRRTLSLSSELVDMLIPLVASRAPGELLFPGSDGGRLPHIEVYKRGWAPAVARARVCDTHYAKQKDGRGNPPTYPKPCDCPGVIDKTPRLHDLRHGQASWLIAAGVPMAAISRRLGHSSINVTIDLYGHLDPSLDHAIDTAVDAALVRR